MRFNTPPGLDDLVEMAEHALAAIPQPLRDMVRGTAILVEDVPDDETLQEMGLESPWELTGLYQGVPLTQKSAGDVPREPDRILLYAHDGEALLDEINRRGHTPLTSLVRRSSLEDVFLRLTGRTLID